MLTGIRTLIVPKLIMAAYFYGQVGICMNFYDDIDRYSERIAVCSEDGTKHTYGDLIKSADKLCADISVHWFSLYAATAMPLLQDISVCSEKEPCRY